MQSLGDKVVLHEFGHVAYSKLTPDQKAEWKAIVDKNPSLREKVINVQRDKFATVEEIQVEDEAFADYFVDALGDGELKSRLAENPEAVTTVNGFIDELPKTRIDPCPLSFVPAQFNFIKEAYGQSKPCPTRYQVEQANKVFDELLEQGDPNKGKGYGNGKGITYGQWQKYDNGAGGLTVIRPGGDHRYSLKPSQRSKEIIKLTEDNLDSLIGGQHYNFIITSDKEVYIVPRKSPNEYGEKHQQLAGEVWGVQKDTTSLRGEDVGIVLAGEAKVHNGSLVMDLRSGTMFQKSFGAQINENIWDGTDVNNLIRLENIVEGILGERPLAVRRANPTSNAHQATFNADIEAAKQRYSEAGAKAASAPRVVVPAVGSVVVPSSGPNAFQRIGKWWGEDERAPLISVGVLGSGFAVVTVALAIYNYWNSSYLPSTTKPVEKPARRSADANLPPAGAKPEGNQAGDAQVPTVVAPGTPPGNVPALFVQGQPVSQPISPDIVAGLEEILGDHSRPQDRDLQVEECLNSDRVLITRYPDGSFRILKNYGKIPGLCGNQLSDGKACSPGREVRDPYTQCGGSIGLEGLDLGQNYSITRTAKCSIKPDSQGEYSVNVTYSEPEKVSGGVCKEAEIKDTVELGQVCQSDIECKGRAYCDSYNNPRVCVEFSEHKIYTMADSKLYDNCVAYAQELESIDPKPEYIEYSCFINEENKQSNTSYHRRKTRLYPKYIPEFNQCVLSFIDLGKGENCPAGQ